MTSNGAGSAAQEPCSRCGEETGAGRTYFSDRQTIQDKDGHRVFLCSLCDPRIRTSRQGQRLTADEAGNLAKNGSAAALTWGGGTGGIGTGG
jgi:hypothetical protein